MAITNMQQAKSNKNDEFYTTEESIVREVFEYKEHFRGKHIFMNADDPEESNFWHYFKRQFDFFELKKITSTHFHGTKPTYRLDYDGTEVLKTPLEQNGDFRSPEAIEILKEADIVVTNPPFSLFREYVAQLIEYNKDFLIIGNMNAITYRETFPLIKENKMWLGVNNGAMEFELPKDAPKKSAQRIDENGIRYQKFGNIAWYTNLEHNKRREKLILTERYNEENYPKYDNYDAINVDRVNDIPEDYYKTMGVPITFLTKHNPNQFEIVAIGNSRHNFTPTKQYLNAKKHLPNGNVSSGGAINNVLTIKSEEKPKKGVYFTSDNSGYLYAPYARILIRKIEGEED